ncbi:uncharacterized protein EI90DRAFT_3076875 [Cantharellus anzutake]|uniref:uncharacterized protein n=1 Tax=Cantharellus anzutake TaxID=1750568 RepID=UPI001906378E|nr:uncharacterized protein EI90DRAFT_3076875 [Cantharellus anzutake]KAF8323508.1 hypothetical protein EI90DRAFT_3076875 [Cantharellus anzutake]
MRASMFSLVRVLPRSSVPKAAVIERPKSEIRIEGPSLIRELVARQEAAGENWPPNLRIETFEDKKPDWVGVKGRVRQALKKWIKER